MLDRNKVHFSQFFDESDNLCVLEFIAVSSSAIDYAQRLPMPENLITSKASLLAKYEKLPLGVPYENTLKLELDFTQYYEDSNISNFFDALENAFVVNESETQAGTISIDGFLSWNTANNFVEIGRTYNRITINNIDYYTETVSFSYTTGTIAGSYAYSYEYYAENPQSSQIERIVAESSYQIAEPAKTSGWLSGNFWRLIRNGQVVFSGMQKRVPATKLTLDKNGIGTYEIEIVDIFRSVLESIKLADIPLATNRTDTQCYIYKSDTIKNSVQGDFDFVSIEQLLQSINTLATEKLRTITRNTSAVFNLESFLQKGLFLYPRSGAVETTVGFIPFVRDSSKQIVRSYFKEAFQENATVFDFITDVSESFCTVARYEYQSNTYRVAFDALLATQYYDVTISIDTIDEKLEISRGANTIRGVQVQLLGMRENQSESMLSDKTTFSLSYGASERESEVSIKAVFHTISAQKKDDNYVSLSMLCEWIDSFNPNKRNDFFGKVSHKVRVVFGSNTELYGLRSIEELEQAVTDDASARNSQRTGYSNIVAQTYMKCFADAGNMLVSCKLSASDFENVLPTRIGTKCYFNIFKQNFIAVLLSSELDVIADSVQCEFLLLSKQAL